MEPQRSARERKKERIPNLAKNILKEKRTNTI